MEIKKSPEADLENKRGSFFLIGLAIMLSVVYVALEWTKKDVQKYDETASLVDDDVEDLVPITVQENTPPPPPPEEAVAPPPVVTDIQIVTNETETGDVNLASSETDQSEDVQVQAPVAVVEIEEEEIDEVISFAIIEEKPSFPGGDAAMQKWIASHVKYPAKAAENGDQGRVTVGFVIGKDGKVTDVKILRGKSPELDKEAIRVVSSMPAWTPGKQRGKAVKVSYALPVNFRLSN